MHALLGNSRLGRRKVRLWLSDPRCHWCGRVTVLASLIGKRRQFAELATIDHLYSRLHPLRSAPKRHPREERTVIACHECNLRRSQREVATTFGRTPVYTNIPSVEYA